MGNSFTIFSFLALAGCLIAGLGAAWLLYGRSVDLPRPVRITLAALRTVVITLILWLLFAPLVYRISYTLEKPIVIIAQDNSQSAGAVLPAGFDSLKYRQDLERLRVALSEKYEVRTYSFSDHVRSGLDFSYAGKLTNAAVLARKLTDELMNRNVGAVVLATDGIFNRGGNPILDMEALNAPVYTIALGDTIPKKDILIANVNVNDLVYLDNDFIMEVQVQAFQCDAGQSKLVVEEGGKLVHQEIIPVKGDLFSKNIPVRLKASKLGQHNYTVSLSAMSNEVSLKNNTQQVLTEVIDDRQKILIAAEGPHPDIAALRQAISLNKHYDVTVVLNEALIRTDLKPYGLIILYQLPGQQFDVSAFTAQLTSLKVPLWYILGAQSDVSKFNRLQDLVSLSGNNSTLQYTFSDISKNISAFDLDSVSRKTIRNFDPLQAPFVKSRIPGNSQVILNQRIGKVGTDNPQLFFITDNGRKTGYLIGEGIWKWKLEESSADSRAPVFNGLVGKVVQYLSVKDDKRKFKVYPAKNTFDESERIILNATLYNDSYLPVNTPDVNIQLKDEKGKNYNFMFSRFESGYQLDAGALPPGTYSYVANTSLGAKKYVVKGSFFVTAQMAEFQQTIADHHLLYQLSGQTGGKMYAPDQLSRLKDELDKGEKMKTLSYEDRKYEELINLKWLLFLILFFLGTEWLLRKRNGAL